MTKKLCMPAKTCTQSEQNHFHFLTDITQKFQFPSFSDKTVFQEVEKINVKPCFDYKERNILLGLSFNSMSQHQV